MKRSEVLAKEGKIEVYVGSLEIALVISKDQMSKRASKLRYIGTDYEASYNGNQVWANVYEDVEGNLFATIE